MEETEGDFGGSGVSFDARQGRTKIMLYWLYELTMAQAQEDIKKWMKCLRSLYIVCSPFIKRDKAAELRKEIKNVNNNIKLCLNRSINIDVAIAVDGLEDLTDKMLLYFKDQFMKTEDTESEEFTEEGLLSDD